MKKSAKYSFFVFSLIYGVLLGSCTRNVPSQHQLTQSADIKGTTSVKLQDPLAELTPEPAEVLTPTAQVLANVLTIQVLDPGNIPIANASVTLYDENAHIIAEKLTDTYGQVSWVEFRDGEVQFEISAEGYRNLIGAIEFKKGTNEKRVKMVVDPYHLSLEQACRAEEQVLYREDFQDGHAQGWDDSDPGMKGWNIIEEPAEMTNLVLMVDSLEDVTIQLDSESFEQMVWRLKFTVVNPFKGELIFKWMLYGDSYYQFGMDYEQSSEPLIRVSQGESVLFADPKLIPPAYDTWHLLELSSYQGLVWVFLDDEEYNAYLDLEPLLRGTIGMKFQSNGGTFMLDDFAVCGLNSPFVPLNMESPTN